MFLKYSFEYYLSEKKKLLTDEGVGIVGHVGFEPTTSTLST